MGTWMVYPWWAIFESTPFDEPRSGFPHHSNFERGAPPFPGSGGSTLRNNLDLTMNFDIDCPNIRISEKFVLEVA